MASIVIIDDDLSMDVLSERLRFAGHDVQRMPSAVVALEEIQKVVSADLVFLDIIMPSPGGLVRDGSSTARIVGMEVLREIRKKKPRLAVIAYSATQDGAVIEALKDDSHVKFLSKWGSPTLQELVQLVNETLGLTDGTPPLTPFIVHGHNDEAKLALKNYLQNTLHLNEPIILHERPDGGLTVIEKFEEYAACSSIVLVLLTPDDLGAGDADTNEMKRRARQNVIFEMGYFLGMFGRGSGRVLLLHQGPLEIPSDLSGIIYIDISNGIDASGEKIRREIDHVRN